MSLNLLFTSNLVLVNLHSHFEKPMTTFSKRKVTDQNKREKKRMTEREKMPLIVAFLFCLQPSSAVQVFCLDHFYLLVTLGWDGVGQL